MSLSLLTPAWGDTGGIERGTKIELPAAIYTENGTFEVVIDGVGPAEGTLTVKSTPEINITPASMNITLEGGAEAFTFSFHCGNDISTLVMNATLKLANGTVYAQKSVRVWKEPYFTVEGPTQITLDPGKSTYVPIYLNSSSVEEQNITLKCASGPFLTGIGNGTYVTLATGESTVYNLSVQAPPGILAGQYAITVTALSADKTGNITVKVVVPEVGNISLEDVYVPEYLYVNETGRLYIKLVSSANHPISTTILLDIQPVKTIVLKGITLRSTRTADYTESYFGPGVLNLSNYRTGTILKPMDGVDVTHLNVIFPAGASAELEYTFLPDGVPNSTEISFRLTGDEEVEFNASVLVLNYRLSVNRISVSPRMPRAGDVCTVYADLQNTGDGDAAGVTAILYVDGELKDTKRVERIGAGRKATVTFTWYAKEGEHHILVVLSPKVNGDVVVANSTSSISVVGSSVSPIGKKEYSIAAYVFIAVILTLAGAVGYIFMKEKNRRKYREKLDRLVRRYRQSGEPHPDLDVESADYNGRSSTVKLVLPQPNSNGVPWTSCLNCGEKIDYPEYICPSCGADQRELYELYTKKTCAWCGSTIDESWMDVVDKCDGYKDEDTPCDAGPFCSKECLEDHKKMAPHYTPLDDEE